MRGGLPGVLPAIILAACCLIGGGASGAYTKDHPLRVVLVVNGTFGDKSFFDSAASGLKEAAATLPVTTKTIEGSYDRANWQPALAEAADGPYDLIIATTYEFAAYMVDLQGDYPEKRFVLLDDRIDYRNGCCKNVLSIQYRTSEAAYLAGYAAAKLSTTGTISGILGADATPLRETWGGFAEGAEAANPQVKLLRVVANTFTDPAKGKELAFAAMQQGADVIFQIAGRTGLGALQAARDRGIKAIGIDVDQSALFAETDPAEAKTIFTSVEKNVGRSVLLVIQATLDGTAPYGAPLIQGLRDGAVGIARNDVFDATISPEIRRQIDELQAKIIAGDIKVTSEFK